MNVTTPVSHPMDRRLPLVGILIALGLALLWFFVQKAHYVTDYSPATYSDYLWPRRLGFIPHLAGGVVAITAGLVPGHLAYRAGLLALNVAWLVTTGMALCAIRTRRIEQHREWMLRSYTVTFAFVTYRLVASALRQWIQVPGDPIADEIDTVMAWACWAVPLLLAEPLIQLRSMRRAGRAR